MSKLEEKFKETLYSFFEYTNNEECAKQCAEITEQECIDFNEWLEYQHSLGNINTISKTYKELFKLYQKSKENE